MEHVEVACPFCGGKGKVKLPVEDLKGKIVAKCPVIFEDEQGIVMFVPNSQELRALLMASIGIPGTPLAYVTFTERNHKAIVEVDFVARDLPEELKKEVLETVKRCYEKAKRFKEVVVVTP